MTVNKLNIAQIGLGRIGQVHLRSLSTLADCLNVYAVCDEFSPDLEKIAAQYKAQAYKKLDDVLKDPKVDAVVICTPTDTHYDVIMAALNAGKDIFCEKPISQQVAQVLEAADFAEKKKRKLFIGYNRRFDANYRRVRDITREGKIGALHLIHATNYDHPSPSTPYLLNSGTMFLDMVVHDYDLLRFLTQDEPETICVMGSVNIVPELKQINAPDTAASLVRFKNGVTATISSSVYAPYGYDQRIEALGALGGVWSANKTETGVSYSSSGGIIGDNPLPGFLTRYLDSYANEVKAFVDCVINNKPIEIDALESLYSIKMGLAARMSYREKRIVEFSEIKA